MLCDSLLRFCGVGSRIPGTTSNTTFSAFSVAVSDEEGSDMAWTGFAARVN